MIAKHQKLSIVLLMSILTVLFLCACDDSENQESDTSSFTLEVRTTGSGSGIIVSYPEGISCPGECTATFAENTPVTLTAVPEPGFMLSGWSGVDCSDSGPCVITMGQAETVTATFAPGELEDNISIGALMDHARSLSDIAGQNSGHRAAGSAGYDASVEYFKEKLQIAGMTATEQQVEFRYFEELSEPVLEQTAPRSESYIQGQDFETLSYSGSGDVTAKMVFVDPLIPAGVDPNSSTDACEDIDFDGIDLTGMIAVIQRGSCDYQTKALKAQNRGAAGVIIFNEGQTGRTDYVIGSLGANSNITIPVIGLSYAKGVSLYEIAQTDDNAFTTLNLSVNARNEQVMASNLIAETSSGSDSQVVMLGTRLDSAVGSPGVNSGSGAAALLELASQIGRSGHTFANKIRFAWWAGEEGLIGSTYYTENLSQEESAAIGMYLNLDSIASKNFVISVYDGDLSDTADHTDSITDDPNELPSGSDEIETAFTEYFDSQGQAYIPGIINGQSNYYPFIFANIPFGGLSAGKDGTKIADEAALFGGVAGETYDSCRNKACDDGSAINQTPFLLNARAIAYMARTFADKTPLLSNGASRSAGRIAFDENMMSLDRDFQADHHQLRELK
ncbi:M28 family peptidase [Desulfobacterales bacterium HSG16]|nr:M28 family peptidase [Desulfobacterales bacterium HSG16]